MQSVRTIPRNEGTDGHAVTECGGRRRDIVVLLIDDQPILGRALQDMLGFERDIEFHFCEDSTKALSIADALAPTVIIQDLAMPQVDGLSLVKQLRANASTHHTPLIVLSSTRDPQTKAKAFALGASDYLVKLPDRLELVARIRHHSHNYRAHLVTQNAHRRLVASERRLGSEIGQAAEQVRSLLPPPLSHGPVRVDWRFVPSNQLGGDAFGYRWLDERHFAFYLLDVSGHGVAAALHAVSVLNTLRNQGLPATDFGDPAAVMRGLNNAFNIDRHAGRFFTIWYGVYDVDQKVVTYSGGGHPPPLLLTGPSCCSDHPRELATLGPPIGVDGEATFTNRSTQIESPSRLLLYSDGVVEIRTRDGQTLDQEEFTEFVHRAGVATDLLNVTLDRVEQLQKDILESDDCTLMLLNLRGETLIQTSVLRTIV